MTSAGTSGTGVGIFVTRGASTGAGPVTGGGAATGGAAEAGGAETCGAGGWRVGFGAGISCLVDGKAATVGLTGTAIGGGAVDGIARGVSCVCGFAVVWIMGADPSYRAMSCSIFRSTARP